MKFYVWVYAFLQPTLKQIHLAHTENTLAPPQSFCEVMSGLGVITAAAIRILPLLYCFHLPWIGGLRGSFVWGTKPAQAFQILHLRQWSWCLPGIYNHQSCVLGLCYYHWRYLIVYEKELIGNKRYYPKNTPMKVKAPRQLKKSFTGPTSWFFSAGRTNFHSPHKINGETQVWYLSEMRSIWLKTVRCAEFP